MNTFQGQLLGRQLQRKTQPLKRLENIPPILKIWVFQGHTWKEVKKEREIDKSTHTEFHAGIYQWDKMYRKTPGPTLAAKAVLATLLMYKQ